MSGGGAVLGVALTRGHAAMCRDRLAAGRRRRRRIDRMSSHHTAQQHAALTSLDSLALYAVIAADSDQRTLDQRSVTQRRAR